MFWSENPRSNVHDEHLISRPQTAISECCSDKMAKKACQYLQYAIRQLTEECGVSYSFVGRILNEHANRQVLDFQAQKLRYTDFIMRKSFGFWFPTRRKNSCYSVTKRF